MKPITTTALALVAAASATPAAAQYGMAPAPSNSQSISAAPKEEPAKAQKLNPSKKALPALLELQTAVNKNDFASVPAKVAAAQAVATTKEDRYMIGNLQLKAALAAKDNAATSAAIDAIATSGYLDAGKANALYMSLGSTFYNDKQYSAAAAAFQKAATSDPGNSQASALLGKSLFAQGQKAEAAAAFQRAIQASSAGGKKPDEALMKRAVAVAYEAQSPLAVDLGRQWAGAYPSADSWRNSIAIYRNLNRPDVEGTLDLLRLEHAAGALTPAEYGLYARAAADQGNFNEAQAVINAGIAAKVVDPADPQYRDVILGLKTKPMATAADLEVATKTAQNGTALLHIGDRYYAMGNYAKAVELYRMSMGKPGVDAAVANLHIGMALARAGDKAGATTALNAVTGSRAGIAQFWLTYVNQKA